MPDNSLDLANFLQNAVKKITLAMAGALAMVGAFCGS